MATDAESLVARLLEEPDTLPRLEAVIGPVHLSFRTEHRENTGYLFRPRLGEHGEFSPLVPRLDVRYRHDVYHQDPTRPRDVMLLGYTLHLRGSRAAVERVLVERHGEPRPLVDRVRRPGGTVTTTYAAYHPFYVCDSAVGDLAVSWHAEVPRFAIPEPDPVVRRAWLVELRTRIDAATSVDQIEACCRSAPAEAGLGTCRTRDQGLHPDAAFTSPSSDTRDLSVGFAPPVPATLLVEAFGWSPAVGVSRDVHLSTWHLERRGDGRPPVGGALRHWELRATLTRSPTGPRDDDAVVGCFPRGVTEQDEVRDLTIGPRLR